jgi:hypothetical protein
MLAEICGRCDTVEECYEFLLAYAAQGLPSDRGSKSGGQLREFQHRAVEALTGLEKTTHLSVRAITALQPHKDLQFSWGTAIRKENLSWPAPQLLRPLNHRQFLSTL